MWTDIQQIDAMELRLSLAKASPGFKRLIQRAKTTTDSMHTTPPVDGELPQFKDENWAPGNKVQYDVVQGNGCKVHDYVRDPGNFTLLLIDLPRGMDAKDDNDTQLSISELKQVLTGFKAMTTAGD